MTLKGTAFAVLCLALAAGVVTLASRVPGRASQYALSMLSVPASNPDVQPDENAKTPGAETIYMVGQPLLESKDASTRLEFTRILRDLATTQGAASPGPREPQALEILSAAYAKETNTEVKLEIVRSLSQFNVPETAELLNRAIDDKEYAVRKAAQQAKTLRETRMLFRSAVPNHDHPAKK